MNFFGLHTDCCGSNHGRCCCCCCHCHCCCCARTRPSPAAAAATAMNQKSAQSGCLVAVCLCAVTGSLVPDRQPRWQFSSVLPRYVCCCFLCELERVLHGSLCLLGPRVWLFSNSSSHFVSTPCPTCYCALRFVAYREPSGNVETILGFVPCATSWVRRVCMRFFRTDSRFLCLMQGSHLWSKMFFLSRTSF